MMVEYMQLNETQMETITTQRAIIQKHMKEATDLENRSEEKTDAK